MFQAEDGIRDDLVTGVQTCALPILAVEAKTLNSSRVPCIVQHISSRDELSVLASTAITDAPNFYLQDPRPMMLKDYFDPRLRKVMPVHRRLRQATVKFDVDVTFAPALRRGSPGAGIPRFA